MRNAELEAMVVKAIGPGMKYLEDNAPDEKYKKVLNDLTTLLTLSMVLGDLTELGEKETLKSVKNLTRSLKQAEA